MDELAFDRGEFDGLVDEIVPAYQRVQVKKALDLESTTEAHFDDIGLSITGEKRENSSMFYTGAPGQVGTGVWDYIKAETYDLLCTKSAKYASDRKEGSATVKNVITIVATAAAAHFNVAAGVMTGAVTVCLISALKIGKNAWCQANRP